MRRWIPAAVIALVAVTVGIAALQLKVLPLPTSATPSDLRPFVMTIEEWAAARMSYSDGRTVGGTAVYRLEYQRRDHWTLTLVSDDLGALPPGEGKACRNGTYGSIGADGAFRPESSDPGLCNGVRRWIHPGLACCYPWKKEIADGRVTYTDPGERVVFDLGTGLPLLYEAGPVGGVVGQRTRYHLERWVSQ